VILNKIKKISSYTSKKSIVYLFVAIFFAMIIETLSVGLIIPAIAFITDDDFYTKYSHVVTFFINLFPFDLETNNQIKDTKVILIIPGLIFLLVIYFFKAILLSFINLYQIKFTKKLEFNLSNELFKTYLYQPYTFHLNRNSSILLRNIDECNTLANAIYSWIIFTSEVLVLLGISVLLLIFATTSALFAVMFIFFSITFFYLLTKNNLLEWGKERHHLMYLVIKQLQQGFQGIKDIKILGRQNFFLNEFKLNKLRYYSKLYKSEFIKSLPKLWLEFMIISVLIGTTLLLLFQNTELNKILFSIGVFSVAAFRILPSINRIINCLQTIRNNLSSINNIIKEISLKKNMIEFPNIEKFNYKSDEINIKNLSYSYPNTIKTSLNSINMTIKKGETVGIIGQSGSGKSTLLDIILGLLPLEKDENISIFGNKLNASAQSWQKEIGYVSQNIYLTDDTIKKNIALGIEDNLINKEKLFKSIELSQLEDFINKLENGVNSIVGERGGKISGGEKQRIGIARALYKSPSVLVLDEATSSLDLKNEELIIETINSLKRKKTIIIVSHRPSTVKICDTVYKMENGKITRI
jgi:ATP-binding cassette, subfamily B, bacterial PglK